MALVLDGSAGISGVDGTASNPSYEGTDSNTGIFYPAADTVAIGTGGTERLRVDSSGNVGIATTSPDGGLDVEKQNSYFGDTTNGGRLYFRRGVDGSAVGRVGWISGSNVNFEIANDSGSGNILFQTNSAERMRLDASGNLLVGTTTTTNNLRLNESLAVVKAGSGQYPGVAVTGYVGTNNSVRPLFDFNRSRGTTDGSMTAVTSGDFLGSIIFRGSDGTSFQDAALIQAEVDGTVGSTVMPGRITFYTSPAGSASVIERARIASGGEFLIGTTTVNALLRVAGSSATHGRIQLLASTNASDSASSTLDQVKTANDSTTANIFQKFFINAGNTGSGQINANGASAAAFGTQSDSRLKENITDLPPQLQNILALRPVEFDYIESEGGGHQLGFIAQEVQEVYPDLVSQRADGMLTLSDMNKNDARLIKAFQELAAKVTALEAEIAALKGNA